MLSILRTQPKGAAGGAFLDAAVSFRSKNAAVQDYPDIPFKLRTYSKISEDKPDKEGCYVGDVAVGALILLPINMFFDTMSEEEQFQLYNMYAKARLLLEDVTRETLRDVQNSIESNVTDLVQKLNLPTRLIEFCKTPKFQYPDLSDVGNKPHHSKEKTFLHEDYVEITAISILCKIMVPIWGQLIHRIGELDIEISQREKIAFDLIEPSLSSGAFTRIYKKLYFVLSSVTSDLRKATDKKTMGGTDTSFILTHNGIDTRLFNDIVMAIIIVKRMATYECFPKPDGSLPNAMVYIDDGIKKTTDTKIKFMRGKMNTMPHRTLSNHSDDDNSSILDHISKTSKKPIDTPIIVTEMARLYGIPHFLEETKTPMKLYEDACEYYRQNPFTLSPLTQAMVASFAGTRFGGSKCLQYMTPQMYQNLVVMLQIFLIKKDMLNLAALLSSNSSATPIEGAESPIAMQISTNAHTYKEYIRLQELIKGFLEKPAVGNKKVQKKQEADMRIDFVNHIKKMIEWLTRYSHSENMAPVLWAFAKVETRPIAGTACKFDQYIIRDLCRFYLIFHDEVNPFE